MLVIAVIYRLLQKYVVPLFRITSATNDHLRKMQGQMDEINKKMNKNMHSKKSKRDSDYIDYEEIK